MKRRHVFLSIAFLAAMTFVAPAAAQSTLPEPIYWRQNLFLIPYQWDTSAGGGQKVVLYVSKDRGATWQSISEAQSHVRAFTYRAESDGEFWFAIRTLDARGTTLPHGPMQPELRVIVDTTIPQIDELDAARRDDGTLVVRWRAADANFDPRTSTIEAQFHGDGRWQPVPITGATPAAAGAWEGLATLPTPAGGQPTAVRFTAFDLARNRAMYQASVGAATDDSTATWPAIISGRGDSPVAPPDFGAFTPLPQAAPQAAAPQPWPADRVAREWPEFSGGEGSWSSDAVTYGTPASVGPSRPVEEEPFLPPPRPDDRPLGDVPLDSRPPFAPLAPFRESSPEGAQLPATPVSLPLAGSPLGSEGYSWLENGDLLPPGATPKLVNTRTFALDYELNQPGHEGVARVELWGTRDGGRTWQKFTDDEDGRSPIVATVDGEGLYGLRLVVQSAAGRSDFAPQPGDRPDVWIGVDQRRPIVMLTSVEPAAGGEIELRWEADDDNLLPRPIALFYSSRPSGPWTAIATNLANTGQHTWRPERYVPPRVYLRLEARDTAGNLAAFQTTEPLNVEPADSLVRAADVQSVTSATPWPPETAR